MGGIQGLLDSGLCDKNPLMLDEHQGIVLLIVDECGG
jgi:hypothetical protein